MHYNPINRRFCLLVFSCTVEICLGKNCVCYAHHAVPVCFGRGNTGHGIIFSTKTISQPEACIHFGAKQHPFFDSLAKFYVSVIMSSPSHEIKEARKYN